MAHIYNHNLQDDVGDYPGDLDDALIRSRDNWLGRQEVVCIIDLHDNPTVSLDPVQPFEEGLYLYNKTSVFDENSWNDDGRTTQRKITLEIPPLRYTLSSLRLTPLNPGTTRTYERRVYSIPQNRNNVLVHYRTINIIEGEDIEDSGEDMVDSSSSDDDTEVSENSTVDSSDDSDNTSDGDDSDDDAGKGGQEGGSSEAAVNPAFPYCQPSGMMMQQHQQQGQPPAGWNQQSAPSSGQQQHQQHYGGGSQNPGSDNEIRSLWIGDLQPWMDERYIMSIFGQTGEFQAQSAKVIRNKLTAQCEGYGFIEFANHAAAERVLQTYNGTQMPNCEQTFRLNWAGERRQAEGPDYTIFVGNLAPEVTDYMLTETFTNVYASVKGAKVVTDRTTGRSKGYGFVRFGDESEQKRAMGEMNGQYCSTRPMRIGLAANKKPLTMQPGMYQDTQGGNPGENDPNNTTIFVGALDASITDDDLKSVFGQFGELIHVQRCVFVQYANRACAEHALLKLNGTQLGGQSIRLSWGRSLNKQSQPDQAQWNGGG